MKKNEELREKYERLCKLLYIVERFERGLDSFANWHKYNLAALMVEAVRSIKAMLKNDVEEIEKKLLGFKRPKQFKHRSLAKAEAE